MTENKPMEEISERAMKLSDEIITMVESRQLGVGVKIREALTTAQAKGEAIVLEKVIKLAQEFKGERYSSDVEIEFENFLSRLTNPKPEGGKE